MTSSMSRVRDLIPPQFTAAPSAYAAERRTNGDGAASPSATAVPLDAPAPPHPLEVGQFAKVPASWLGFLRGQLNGTEWVVLLAMVAKTNFSAKVQGGVPAVFASATTIAKDLGIENASHVREAQARLIGLGIYRPATEEEEDHVRRWIESRYGTTRGRGRPPSVRVLVDPHYWKIP
jgi:hypothetical protein